MRRAQLIIVPASPPGPGVDPLALNKPSGVALGQIWAPDRHFGAPGTVFACSLWRSRVCTKHSRACVMVNVVFNAGAIDTEGTTPGVSGLGRSARTLGRSGLAAGRAGCCTAS